MVSPSPSASSLIASLLSASSRVAPVANLLPSSPGAGSSSSHPSPRYATASPLHDPYFHRSSSPCPGAGQYANNRFGDGQGTQSMYVTSPLHQPNPLQHGRGNTIGRPGFAAAVIMGGRAGGDGGMDPLSQSLRIQPPRRNRLDAREAASKLANFL